MGPDLRLSGATLLALLTLSGISACQDEDRTTHPATALDDDPTESAAEALARLPSPPSPPSPAVTSPPRRMDDSGRLRKARDRVYGFEVPVGLELGDESPGSMSFTLLSLRRPLKEFYAHRHYHVIRQPAGFQIKHSSTTLEDQPTGVYDGAQLFISATAPQRFTLRFTRPSPTKSALPSINEEFLKRRTDLSPAAKAALQRKIERTRIIASPASQLGVAKSKRPLPPTTSFNPGVPKGARSVQVKGKVEQWLEANPGELFYD